MSWLDEPGLRPPLQNSSNPRDREPKPTPTDPDALLRWQEERIARRLRGEYESAVVDLNELVCRLHMLYRLPETAKNARLFDFMSTDNEQYVHVDANRVRPH